MVSIQPWVASLRRSAGSGRLGARPGERHIQRHESVDPHLDGLRGGFVDPVDQRLKPEAAFGDDDFIQKNGPPERRHQSAMGC